MSPKKTKKTRIIVQVDAETVAPLYLRGEGLSTLNWDKGIAMKRERPDEWVFETDELFETGAFKVLMDDQTFELGESHPLYPSASIRINPKFPKVD